MNNYRHGDLIFTPIKEVPQEAKVRETNQMYPLAFGEATGHSHKLKGKAKVYDLPKDELILAIDEDSELSHEEHDTITFKPGLYLMRREQEFDYFTEEINQVLD